MSDKFWNDGDFEAFLVDGWVSIGKFATEQDALDALSARLGYEVFQEKYYSHAGPRNLRAGDKAPAYISHQPYGDCNISFPITDTVN
jgi:hypothetical protein